MVMAYRADIRSRCIYRTMDYALRLLRKVAPLEGLAVEVEFEDVVQIDEFGRARAWKVEAVRPFRVSQAHMPESVEDALAGEYAIEAQHVPF
jgi:hypothetical protein